MGPSDRQDKSCDDPSKPHLTVRLAPSESLDGTERLRKAYELVLSVEAGGGQLSTDTGGASLLAEQQGATEGGGAAEPADGE